MTEPALRRVFVSSTFVDLSEYRATVRDLIRQLGALDICMETLGARDERPLAECIRIVRENTDVFVGIYAHRYGHIPDGEKRSITEIEYATATEAGWSCFIYMIDEKVPWLVDHIDSGSRKTRLNTFKKRLMADHICKRFTNRDQLAAFIAADLGREFARRELSRVADSGAASVPGTSAPEADWTKGRIQLMRNNRNVFLVHTIEPSGQAGQEYDLSIFLAPHPASDPKHRRKDLSDVTYAEFFLGAHWGNRVFRVENSGGLVGLTTAAYGPFLCIAKVVFSDGASSILQRYVDFAMGPTARECRELRPLIQR